MSIIYGKSEACQLTTVKKLLDSAHLPFEDIDAHFQNYIVASSEGAAIGAIGVECHKSDGLLRSFVVDESYRGKGIGKELLERLMTLARSLDISALFLLTTTASDYFSSHGFSALGRDDLPETIKRTKEFADICPVSAIYMVMRI